MARILVAEDDDNVRSFVVRALQMSGHDVLDASDGGLALEMVAEHKGEFDLLVSDIKMPVMDGISLALSVGADYPDLTILSVTPDMTAGVVWQLCSRRHALAEIKKQDIIHTLRLAVREPCSQREN